MHERHTQPNNTAKNIGTILSFEAYKELVGDQYCAQFTAEELQRLYEASITFYCFAYKHWIQSRQKMVK